MPQFRYPFLALCTALVAGGCHRCPSVESEPEIRRDVVVATQADRLRVETRDGDITVRAGTVAGEVAATAHVIGIGMHQAAAASVRDKVEIVTEQADGVVTVGWRWSTPAAECEEARVRFEITAPPQWFVELESKNGELVVEGVGAAGVDLESKNGTVRALDVDGPVKAETKNGAVQLKGASPTVDLETKNGSIGVALTGEGPVSGSIETGNGSINVSTGARACTVRAASDNGDVRLQNGTGPDSGGVVVSGSGKGSAVFGDAEVAGSHELQVSSDNGTVVVRVDSGR